MSNKTTEQFKDVFSSDKINKSIGLIQNAKVEYEGDKLSVSDSMVFVTNASNRNDVEVLQNYLKERNRQIPAGTFVFYDLKKARSLKNHWEIFDKIQNLANAIRILTHKDCNYSIHMQYNDSGDKTLYYKPIYIVDPLDPRFFGQDVAIVKKQEIELLKKIFIAIDKLNPQNQKGFNRLKNALNFYEKACDERSHLQQLINFFVVLESLFSDSEKSEIAYKIRLRTSYVTCSSRGLAKRKEVFNLIKLGYDIRSYLLHGSDVENFIQRKVKQNSYSFFLDYLPKLRKIVDYTLEKILLNKKMYMLFSDNKLLRNDKSLKEFLDYLVLNN